MSHDKIDARAVVILTVLCLIWGLNAVAMKYATEGIAPLFCAKYLNEIGRFRPELTMMWGVMGECN